MCLPTPSWNSSHLPPHSIPSGLSALLQVSNLHWSSISHTVIYMFQCYSLKLYHPHLLSHSPTDCSVHQCLFCCLVYALISFFLNCWISFLVSFVCWLSLLYFVYWAVLVLLMGVYVCAYIS